MAALGERAAAGGDGWRPGAGGRLQQGGAGRRHHGEVLDRHQELSLAELALDGAFFEARLAEAELDRVTAASTMAEGVDAVAQEDEPSVALFELLSAGLSTLDAGPAHPDLVTAFLLQMAAVIGLAPSLDLCAGCGKETGLDRFSFAAGGVVCESCRPDGAVRLRPGLTGYLADLAHRHEAFVMGGYAEPGDPRPRNACSLMDPRGDEMLRMLDVADEFGFAIRAFHHAVDKDLCSGNLKQGVVLSDTGGDDIRHL